MERGKLWRTAFGGNIKLLELNLPGLTDGLAAVPPAAGVATPAWVLGHIIHARFGLMALLGAPPIVDPIWKSTYARHSDGLGTHLPLSELVDAFNGTDSAMKAALLAVEDWDKPTLNPGLRVEQPLEQVVSFLYMHECYHLGQFGIFRKLLGLAGAV